MQLVGEPKHLVDQLAGVTKNFVVSWCGIELCCQFLDIEERCRAVVLLNGVKELCSLIVGVAKDFIVRLRDKELCSQVV